jgi:NAD(P)H-flavin reductase
MTEDSSWDGERRTIDGQFLHDHLEGDLDSYTYLVAGPPPMVEGVVETMKSAGIAEEHIRPDRFSGY